MPVSGPFVSIQLDQAVCFSIGEKYTPEQADEIIRENKEKMLTYASEKYKDYAQAWIGMQTSLAWNLIYDSKNKRPMINVSRLWNIDRGGYALFCWDNFFMGFMAAIDAVSYTHLMVHQAIIDHTGVDLSLNYVSDNVEQKFSLLVTGDTIPDISVLTYDMYMEYAKQGAFYDITDLVDKYPNLMKYVPEAYWESVKVDGKIYGVPTANVEGKYNLYFREDWLENLGLKVPETRDEFTEVLRAFTEDDPDQNEMCIRDSSITAALLTSGWIGNGFMKARKAMPRAPLLKRTVRIMTILCSMMRTGFLITLLMTAGGGMIPFPS